MKISENVREIGRRSDTGCTTAKVDQLKMSHPFSFSPFTQTGYFFSTATRWIKRCPFSEHGEVLLYAINLCTRQTQTLVTILNVAIAHKTVKLKFFDFRKQDVDKKIAVIIAWAMSAGLISRCWNHRVFDPLRQTTAWNIKCGAAAQQRDNVKMLIWNCT